MGSVQAPYLYDLRASGYEKMKNSFTDKLLKPFYFVFGVIYILWTERQVRKAKRGK